AAALQNANAYREIEKLRDRLVQEKRYLEYEIRSANRPDDIIGNSPALKRVLDRSAHRRNRHRQRAYSTRDSWFEPPQGSQLHQGKLRRHSHGTAGKRAVR